jgi:uncharacterized protein (TIGR02996 family)
VSDELAGLEAAIDAAPDDPSGYAVLGDWYQQRGDPRGELIALQLGRQQGDRRGREREDELLHTRGVRLPHARMVQWRWGFAHTLSFELVRHRGWETHLADWPDAMLAPLLAHPSCRFLKELVVDGSPGDAALRFLSTKAPRHLRGLSLICNELDLGLVGGDLRRLERLSVAAQLVTAAPLPCPTLDTLSVPLDALSQTGFVTVLQSVATTLRALTVTSLEALNAKALEPVLSLPALERLTLKAERLGRAVVDALARSPLAQRLTTLDLSHSGITGDAAQRMLKLASRFDRLSSLVLGEAVDAG